MTIDRRTFLKTMGLGGVGAINAQALVHALSKVPTGAFSPNSGDRSRASHAVNRLTFGVSPTLYREVIHGDVDAFIERQLNPETVSDSAAETALSHFEHLEKRGGELIAELEGNRGPVINELIGMWITRAHSSQRQLFERMVHFWSDHFHVFIGKGRVAFYKVDDDRDAIRPNTFSTFRNLLGASAKSPAMLLYLDNAMSRDRAPNENYGRELLELHTLGVDGGYTEADVKGVARAFTGWSISDGLFRFRPRAHDDDPKTILGQSFSGDDGIQEGETVLDMLAAHPATAQFVMTKLARRFIADDPPQDAVDGLAQAYLTSGGDVLTILRELLALDAFWSAPPKFKRPFEYTISVMRALDYEIARPPRFFRWMLDHFRALGHVPFAWPAPNGYPDVGSYWMANLLARWNVTLELFTGTSFGRPNLESLATLVEENNAGSDLDSALAFLGRYAYGRDLSNDEFETAQAFGWAYGENDGDKLLASLALLMTAPPFQYK